MITGDEDVDYSDESVGVCAIADTTGYHDLDIAFEVAVTLTEHDDCFVMVVEDKNSYGFVPTGFSSIEGSGKLLGLGGNDVLCGSSGHDKYFYGMHERPTQLPSSQALP